MRGDLGGLKTAQLSCRVVIQENIIISIGFDLIGKSSVIMNPAGVPINESIIYRKLKILTTRAVRSAARLSAVVNRPVWLVLFFLTFLTGVSWFMGQTPGMARMAAAVTAALIIYYNEKILLYSFALVLPIEHYYAFLPNFTLTSHELFIFSMLFAMLIKLKRKDIHNISAALTFIAPWAFILILSALFSGSPAGGIKQALKWNEMAMAWILGIYFFQSERTVKIFLACLAFSAAVAAALGIAQFAAAAFPQWSQFLASRNIGQLNIIFNRFLRAHSTFGHANHFANFLLMAMTAPLTFIHERNLVKKALALALLLFLGTALILTFSRGAWSAFLVTLFLVLFLLRPYKALFWGAVSGAAGAAFFLFTGADIDDGLAYRLSSLRNLGEDETFMERLKIYRTGWMFLKKNPCVGLGLGKFKNIMGDLNFLGMPLLGTKTHLHNLYLQITVETGIAGLLAFLLFVFSAFYKMLRRLISSGRRIKEQNFILIWGPTAYLVHSMADVFLYRGLHILFGFLLAAAYVSITRNDQDGNADAEAPPSEKP